MDKKYKQHLQKVMDVLLTIEGAVLILSGLAVVAILYTNLWKRRWKLDIE